MSRCFPYPPPGYTLSRATKDALIESIKLQKQKVKSKEQRKEEKRREKKEKRKAKKDTAKQNSDKSLLVQSHIGEKFWADTKGKGIEAEAEQLERSSLTEEHGKPVCLHVPNTSCDSTENSNKRKRHSSPEDVTRGHGKLIRIKLPLKKQNQSDAPSNEQQRCSTSGRTHNPSQNENVRQRGEDISRAEQTCSTSKPIETFVARKNPNPSTTSAVLSPMQKAELQYKNLIESLVPPQPHMMHRSIQIGSSRAKIKNYVARKGVYLEMIACHVRAARDCGLMHSTCEKLMSMPCLSPSPSDFVVV